jgi:hypothetical protein
MSTATSVSSSARVEDGPRRSRKLTFGVLGALLGFVVVVYAAMAFSMRQSVPADLDLATTQVSSQGLYRAMIEPDSQPIPVNRLHTWTLRVETLDGQPIDDARISVEGDMPQHRHGMPTRPEVTRYLGDGEYLVEGMKFQMGGWWVVDFTVEHGSQSDSVRFNLMLN